MIKSGFAPPRAVWQALVLLISGLIPLCAVAGTTTYTYDVHGRLSSVTAAPSGSNPSTSIITYDNADNRIAVGTDTPPNAPGGLTATAQAYNLIALDWNSTLDANGGAVAKYNIYRGGALLASSTTTSYNDTSVAANTAYTYNVTAVDVTGYESSYSNSASATTPPGPDLVPPTTPTNLQGAAVSGTQINLTWGASTDTGGSGLAGYKIFRNSTQVGTSTVASYSDAGLTPYTTYTYTVAAYDGAGNVSGMSNQAFVQTLDSIPPSAPGNPSFSAITTNSATASWGAATDNVGVVNYRYSLNGGASWVGVGNTTTVNLTGLTIGTPYTMYVEAGDAAGNWGPASSGSFSTSAYYTDTLSLSAGDYVVLNSNTWPYPTVEAIYYGYLQGSFGALSPTTTSTGLSIYSLESDSDYTVGQTWLYLEVTGFASNPGAAWVNSIYVPGPGTFTGASASSFVCNGSTCVWEWLDTTATVSSGTVTLVHR